MTTTDPLSLTEAKRLAGECRHGAAARDPAADLETPIGAFLRLDDGTPAYLLESVEGGERLGRYSFLGIGPRRLLEVRDGTPRSRPGRSSVEHAPDLPVDRSPAADPLAACALRRRAAASRRPRACRASPAGPSGRWPTTRSAAFEPTVPLPDRIRSASRLAAFIETDLVLVFDHLTHTLSRSRRSTPTRPTSRAATGSPSGRSSRRSSGRPARARPSWPARPRRPRGRRRPGARPAVRPTAGSNEPRPRRLHPRRRGRQGRDRVGRGDPGRPRPAPDVRPAGRPATGAPLDGIGLYRSLRRVNPQPVPLLRSHAGVRGRRREPGAPPPGRGRPADDAPDRRHPPARRHAREDALSPSSSSAIGRSAPST